MVVMTRFRWFGWFALCVGVVLGCYLMSSRVAAERNKLARIEMSIATTQRDIKALETEFDTRASFVQLQRWNGDTLKLSAPTAAQYVRDDQQLASLDFDTPSGAPQVQTASAVIPSMPNAAPIAPVPASVPAAPAARPLAPAPVKAAVAMVSAPVGARIQPAAAKAPVKAKSATFALLDRKLLGDLDRGARAEGRGQ